MSVLGFWLDCVQASRGLDGDKPLDDDTVILHFCSHGASALVTVGDIKTIEVKLARYEKALRFYANKSQYKTPPEPRNYLSDIDKDEGKTARNALGEE